MKQSLTHPQKQKQFCNKCIFLSSRLYEMWNLLVGAETVGSGFLSPAVSNIIEKNLDISFKSILYKSEKRSIHAIKCYLKNSHKLKVQLRVFEASRLFLREELPLH